MSAVRPIRAVRVADLPQVPTERIEGDNHRRACLAGAALAHFAALCNEGGESPAQVLADLLADLHHLADALDAGDEQDATSWAESCDWEHLLGKAEYHYAGEVEL